MKKAGVILLAFLMAFSGMSQIGTNVLISQVYGGGGNSGSVYTHDFIELFNPTPNPISLNGWSVQYNSATGTGTWQVTNLTNFTLQPGQYYLVQQAQGTGGTTALPTPNAIGTIAMSGTAGKVALVNNTTALSGACPAGLIDLVGFGLTANCFEGAGPTPAPSNTNSVMRASNGCIDANNNSADFTAVAAAPRNSSSPFSICGGGTPAITVTGTITDFGNITVGNSSTSQSVSLTGSNLTGAPGNLTVTAPSTDFQVSNNNSTWGPTTTIAYAAATLSATPVYVRFSPQSAGPKSGNVSISGGGVSTALQVAVSGTGVAAPIPVITVGTLNGFGNVCVNTTAGPNSFTVSGSNLTAANITVGSLSGYTFATASGGPYSASLSIAQGGGSFNQTIYVQFQPTAIAAYNGNIAVGGGGAGAVNVAASGAGVNNSALLNAGSASGITTTAATVGGSITNNGCSAVTAYGIEYSLTNGFTPGTGTQVASSNISGGAFTSALSGLAPSTTYYFRAYAINSGGTGYSTQSSFATAAPTLTATALTAFGSVCVNNEAGPNSFTLTGVGLTTANINVGPRTGFSFATAATGPYAASLSLTQPGGNYTQIIFVKFQPTVTGSYSGAIPISGGAAVPFTIGASGSGINTPPTVTDGAASNIQPDKVTLSGSITANGCSNIAEYGFEYSSINGFAPGRGQKVTASNISTGNFFANLSALVPNTTYYFRVFARNDGGTTYGAQQSFTTTPLKSGLTLYGVPVNRGDRLRFSLTGITPGHYAVQLFIRPGHLVYQNDIIVQLNFINDEIVIPKTLKPGVYTFRIGTIDKAEQKEIIIL